MVIVEEEIHREDQKKPECLEATLKQSHEVAEDVLDTINRRSFFSWVKNCVVSVPKYIFGSSFPVVSCYLLISFTALLSIKTIVHYSTTVPYDTIEKMYYECTYQRNTRKSKLYKRYL